MNIAEAKKQAEQDISNFIAQKIKEINEVSGLRVSDIDFTAIEEFQGIERYIVEIKLR
ncbi:TPA: addiction module toxin, GnsA/GnsB family [Citrobacter koseri]|nr:addiction module toxin, GnsA/GnsB family [Citrobacter koseri]